MINKIINFIEKLTSSKFANFIFGALVALAFAPYNLLIFLPFSYSFLFCSIYFAKTKKQAFLRAYLFGFGLLFLGLYWIGNSLLIEPEKHAWLLPFSLCGIPIVLALYYGIFGYFTFQIKKAPNEFVIFFLCFYITLEFLRTNLFTGFPWLAIGYSLTMFETIIQTARFGSFYYLSLIALSISILPIVFLFSKSKIISKKFAIIYSLLTLGNLLFANIYGKVKLQEPDKMSEFTARIVQPNISQKQKWDLENFYVNKQILEEFTKSAGQSELDIIIWPESSLPIDFFTKNSRDSVAKMLQPKNHLITGSVRFSNDHLKVWNSAIIIDSQGEIVDYYDKTHLVPFGEYIPFANFLPISKLTNGSIDFSKGQGPKVITLKNGLRIGLSICYETLFPKELTSPGEKPDILINLTNEDWFGDSSGPYQHLEMTRLRAIEEGVPILRVANSGISAIINTNGEILQKISLQKAGIIDIKLVVGNTNNSLDHQQILIKMFVVMLLIIFSKIKFINLREAYDL